MKQNLRVSVAQMSAEVPGRTVPTKREKDRRLLREMLRLAGQRQSDLVLFGEYANQFHRSTSRKRREYLPDRIPGVFTKHIASYARRYRMNIALPILGEKAGVLSSYVLLFDRTGRMAGCYQKAHVTYPESRLGIVPGDSIPVFELDIGHVGIMNCMDIEYPETAQTLMLKGAYLLLFPHVQASWGEIDWEIRYRSRAIDTGLFVVSASYGYPEGEWEPGKIVGRSGIVYPDGLIAADAGRGVGVLTVDIDVKRRRLTDFHFGQKRDRTSAIVASRRPELYGALTERLMPEKVSGRGRK
jgi:predicted amidohydrolase